MKKLTKAEMAAIKVIKEATLKTVEITLRIQYKTTSDRPDKWDWVDLLGFWDPDYGTVYVTHLKELD